MGKEPSTNSMKGAVDQCKKERTVKHSKKTTRFFPILLSESDLRNCGYCHCDVEGGLTFLCSHHTGYIEILFIRSILEPLGYKIIEIDYDYPVEDQEACDFKIVTNYPWKRYCGDE